MPPTNGHEIGLAARVSRHFDDYSRKEGERYLKAGWVKIKTADHRSLSARVKGTKPYDVLISLGEERVTTECTCPRADTGATCKHIWASILAGLEAGYLSETAPAEPLIEMTHDDSFGPDIAPLPPVLDGPKGISDWRFPLRALKQSLGEEAAESTGHEIIYRVFATDPDALGVHLQYRKRQKRGAWGKPHDYRARRAQLANISDPLDREIISLLLGAGAAYTYAGFQAVNESSTYSVKGPLLDVALPRICRTGRMHVSEVTTPWTWDDGEPYTAVARLVPEGRAFTVRGAFERGDEKIELRDPTLVVPGFLFSNGKVARYTFNGPIPLLQLLREYPMKVPKSELAAFVAELQSVPGAVPIELPPELRPEEVRQAPKVRVRIQKPRGGDWRTRARLQATVYFDYPGFSFPMADRRPRALAGKKLILRDPAAEAIAARDIQEIGLKKAPFWIDQPDPVDFEFVPERLREIVSACLTRGWTVEGEGAQYRSAGKITMRVASGIDWFDLEGGIEFGNQTATFPELLKALGKGNGFVKLGDGSMGVLPEEWLEQNGLILGAGTPTDDAIRFRSGQALFLDALLAAEEKSTSDEAFQQLRKGLADFDGVVAQEAPAGFVGTLRDYQKVGLGWIAFLREFSLGGCLADDMGLGKTVQVLAALEARRAEKAGPSLIVVPRSLVFNWISEAARFAPSLRILDYSGIHRKFDIGAVDIVLTTYGTLRRDAASLKDVMFDYVVLDESTAIKNPASATAKAARLLKGRHRLALSGTPIENHLGELWSLMEFLNPGMLGSANVFRDAIDGRNERTAKSRGLLARALRPFILRRTKEKVSPELPSKTEQTISVDLDPAERKRYDELREHYRRELLTAPDWNRNKMNALVGLLRLRQAACHPGLIDPALKEEPSTKVTALLDQLDQVREEGHKALVFSQFTSLLAIVKSHLDKAGVIYEYLDGQTRDRAARVNRFQTDAACPIFLVSLKAGGMGLNLTAAEYVFLLDPWWNPAVEAQAVDRTHRIGQLKPVFAYRIVARDTVEEKVLELQKTKKALADSFLSEDKSFLRDLTKDDLALLLS